MTAAATPLRCWAEISFDALRHNVLALRKLLGQDVKLMAVVKADAYGHGLPQIAGTLMQGGVEMFGTANLGEAKTIRMVGAGWKILLLSASLPEETEEIVRNRFSPSITSLEEAVRFDGESRRHGLVLPVHVKVDTGMGRIGFWHESAPVEIPRLKTLENLKFTGIYSHFATADENPAFARRQLQRFNKVLKTLRGQGMEFPVIHCANSAGLLALPGSRFNMVRPGLLIYGVSPLPRFKGDFMPALTFKTRIGFLKKVQPGRTFSYGATFTARRPMKTATLCVGYGDGYSRQLSGRSDVLIGGKRCPILGRVTMDQIVVDVSRVPRAKVGDEVVLIGQQGKNTITADELARLANTIPYEIFTAITKRVPRIYIGGTAA